MILIIKPIYFNYFKLEFHMNKNLKRQLHIYKCLKHVLKVQMKKINV